MKDILQRLEHSVHPTSKVKVDSFHDMIVSAIQEIKSLRKALHLSVGELSTHPHYSTWSPEQLLIQFLEESKAD